MRETVKTKKASNNQKIFFTPQNEEEKEHLNKLYDLLSQKRRGDWGLVAEIMEIPKERQQSVEKAFLRVYSKNHFKAVKALEEVIDNRKKLLKQ